jgi:hypothetical protein
LFLTLITERRVPSAREKAFLDEFDEFVHVESMPSGCRCGRKPLRVHFSHADCERITGENSAGIVSLLSTSIPRFDANPQRTWSLQAHSTFTLLPNEIKRVDGHPAPAFDDVCRRLLSDCARLDGELVTDAYLVEEHVHRAFNEELDDVQRLRLGTLLCAIYIRLGHGPASLLVLRYLCAIWVLLNSGVASG